MLKTRLTMETDKKQHRILAAGHAGDVLGDKWYIAGGGDNASGCGDTIALELGGLASGERVVQWEELVESSPSSPTALEGMSLVAAPLQGLLLAFGGYNGKYNNDVRFFLPGEGGRGTLKTLNSSLWTASLGTAAFAGCFLHRTLCCCSPLDTQQLLAVDAGNMIKPVDLIISMQS